MSEEKQTYKGKVKQKGLFHFSDIYTFMYDYLMDEGYDVREKEYQEKRIGDAKELNIKWNAFNHVSDYFTFVISTEWIILGMTDVEVPDKDNPNIKIKTNSGVVEIKISSSLIKDNNDAWEGKFWKPLRKIYDKYIIRNRIEQYEETVIEETNKYIAFIRSLLEMQSKHTVRRETMA